MSSSKIPMRRDTTDLSKLYFPWRPLHLRNPQTKGKRHKRVPYPTHLDLVDTRFVDGLQERIKLLEQQLNSRPPAATSAGRNDGPRRLSDHDRDHNAAAALSSLARVPSPTIPPFNEASPYRSPEAE